MSAFAHRVRPPLAALVALVGLTLAMRPEEPVTQTTYEERALPWPGAGQVHVDTTAELDWLRTTGIISPPAFRDARPWNDGGMVISPPPVRDPIAHNAVTALLSGLFRALGSLAA